MIPLLLIQLVIGSGDVLSAAGHTSSQPKLFSKHVQWRDNYAVAYQQAKLTHKDLFIHFRDDEALDDALDQAEITERLTERFVCLRVPTSYEHKNERLLDHDFLAEMNRKSGLAIVSLHDESLPTHGHTISVHPFVRSHYRWVPGYGAAQVKIMLDLPKEATLSQRSMIYAVRVHPERPRSIDGLAHPVLLAHAADLSGRQAAQRHQYHDLAGAMARCSAAGVAINASSEVVAESWGKVVGGENVLEAAFSCVDAWRHSSGHWGAVSRAQRYYGYDIAKGSNGTWYATGIFAD